MSRTRLRQEAISTGCVIREDDVSFAERIGAITSTVATRVYMNTFRNACAGEDLLLLRSRLIRLCLANDLKYQGDSMIWRNLEPNLLLWLTWATLIIPLQSTTEGAGPVEPATPFSLHRWTTEDGLP